MRTIFWFDDETEQQETEQQETEQQQEKRYTDADLDRIIEKKFARWKEKEQKRVDEAKRLAELSAQERAEAERDSLQKELDALKRANTKAEMEKTARQILSDDGVHTIPDVIIGALIRDDADTTSKAVKAFTTAYKAAVKAGVQEALGRKKPTVGAGAGTITREQIMAEKDTAKRQRMIKQHMSLFR